MVDANNLPFSLTRALLFAMKHNIPSEPPSTQIEERCCFRLEGKGLVPPSLRWPPLSNSLPAFVLLSLTPSVYGSLSFGSMSSIIIILCLCLSAVNLDPPFLWQFHCCAWFLETLDFFLVVMSYLHFCIVFRFNWFYKKVGLYLVEKELLNFPFSCSCNSFDCIFLPLNLE